jgi:hypothetical protein
MVAFQSTSRSRGRRVRFDRLTAPRTAARVELAIRRSISATTLPTTIRAVRLVVSGITLFRLTSVAARCTSGCTESSSSGSSSMLVRFSRSMASRCITWTTLVGK